MAGTNLTTLRGVGAAKAKKIEAAGFTDVESLAGAELGALVGAGFSEKAASALIATAVKEVGAPTPPADEVEDDAPMAPTDAKKSSAPKDGPAKGPDTAPRHIGADKKRSSMGVSLESRKKKKGEDDDTKRKAEFRRRWESGANPSSLEEFRWVKEFLR